MKRLLFICAFLCLASAAQAQTPVGLAPVPKPVFLQNGAPLVNGCLFTFSAGTTTPLGSYTDSSGSALNANPIILDANGSPANAIYLTGAPYKFQLKSAGGTNCASGSIIWTADNVSATAFLNVANTWTALQTFSAGVTSTGTTTITNLNGDVYLDGTKYATLAAAVAAVPSGGTVRISAGTYSITATVNMGNNLDIECSPNNASILQAGASLNAPMIQASGINHFRIAGCVIDGNRSGNTNQFNLLQIATSSHGEITGNHFQNNQGRVINITNGNSHLRITDNEINNYGQVLPASNGNEGISVGPVGAGAGNSHIEISSNKIHDGNIGIGIFTSSNAANITSDIDIAHNRVWATANDGILPFTVGAAGALIQGLRIEDNEAYCTGWPANGTGFSANCTAGLLQAGSTASSSGVGIDVNGAAIDQPIVIGNRSHDNFFEGIDAVAQTITTVNCTNVANSVCTVVSGDPFNTSWKANQAVRINGSNFLIQSVASTSSLTLTTNTGALTGVPFTGVGYMRGTLIGNVAYNNGRGNSGTSGSGFSDSAYGNTWSGNVSYSNQSYGFIDQLSSFVTHTGDKAYNNGLRAGSQPGFLAQDVLNPSYIGVTTDDSQAVPTQTTGINFSGLTNNGYADSSSIVATQPVSDSGTGDTWRIGRTLLGQPPCLFTTGSGGTYCIAGSASGGNFTANLPAVNGTLSPLIAQDCGTTTTCSATNISATVKVVKGTVTLNAATPGVATVTGISPAFTSTSSYSCIVTTQTTVANGKKCTKVSTSSITITGVAGDSDVVDYILLGN